jgi:hypothetical protein
VVLSHDVKGAAALAAAVDDGPVQLEPSSEIDDAYPAAVVCSSLASAFQAVDAASNGAEPGPV